MQDLTKELTEKVLTKRRNDKRVGKISREIFVEVLEILQEQGIDLRYLKPTTKSIKELIEVCNKNGMKIEASVIEKALSGKIAASGKQIDLSWNIGGKLQATRIEKEVLKEELGTRETVFSEEVIKSIVGKEKSSMEILIDVLEILQGQGIELSYVKQHTKSIKELIEVCNENGMQIEAGAVEEALRGKIAASGVQIDLSWKIGKQLASARSQKEQLREEVVKRQKEGKNVFSEDVIKSIVGKEKNGMEILVDILEILQEQGIDLIYLRTITKNIKELIEVCNKNGMQIEESIVEKALNGKRTAHNKPIDLTWKIGEQLASVRRQKQELREELERRKNGDVNLFSENIIKSIVGNEIKAEKSRIEIFVEVLEILQEQGIDLSYLKPTTKSIKELIEVCNKNGMQIEESAVEEALSGKIAAYGQAIDLSWSIGSQLNIIRRKKEELREEMTKRQKGEANVFSEDIIKRIVGNEIKIEKSNIEILVDILEILQEQGIDLSYLRTITKNIKELIEVCNKNGMQIGESGVKEVLRGKIAASGVQIDLSWKIGEQLVNARRRKQELREELERRKNGDINVFSENIIKSIVGNEKKAEKSRIEILVDVLEILQEQGIDLSYVKRSTKSIKELIEVCNENGMQIEASVVEEALRGKVSVSGQSIDLSWNIGSQLNNVRDKREELREEMRRRLKEGKNVFSKGMGKSIVGKEKSSIEVFVEILEILQEQGIELSYLKPTMKSIKELIEECSKRGIKIEEQAVEEALRGKKSASGEEIDLSWNIGNQLYGVRLKKDELKEEMSRRQKGEENVFSEDVIKSLVDSKNIIEILVDVLEILQEQGVDLSYLKPTTSSIRKLIEVCNKNGMQIEESIVKEALSSKRTIYGKTIGLSWEIGRQLNNVRRKREELREEMGRRKNGDKNVFSEEVINHIGGEIKGQQLGKASFTATVDDCDAVERAIREIQIDMTILQK